MTADGTDRRPRRTPAATDTDDERDAGPDPDPDPDTVRERLRAVVDPCSGAVGTDLDVVEMGLVEDVTLEAGDVTVSMRLTSPGCLMVEYFAREVEEVVGSMTGVESVTLETDAGFDWHRGMMEDQARAKRDARRRELERRYGDELDHRPTRSGEDPARHGGNRTRTGTGDGTGSVSGRTPDGSATGTDPTAGEHDDGD